jgi:hypothetical protein
MPTSVQRASQYEFSDWGRGPIPVSFAAIAGEQNRHAALPAANAEIPLHVRLGPSRNIHKSILLPSAMLRIRLLRGSCPPAVFSWSSQVCAMDSQLCTDRWKRATSISSKNAFLVRFHLLERQNYGRHRHPKGELCGLRSRSGFFLEVFDRHEEDSPGMNRRKIDVNRIVLMGLPCKADFLTKN